VVVRTASPDLVTRAPASVPVASDSPVNVGTPAPGDQDAEQSLYLIGRPPLKQFLKFVRNYAVDPPGESALTDAWQAANAVVRQLEKQEAGVADDPPLGKLGPEYEPLLIEFLKDPLVHNGFNTVPTEVAIVELDRMVVYQEHIDVTHTGRVEQRLGAKPSPADVFRTCLPYDHPQPPVRWSRVSDGKFVFLSPSNDLRFLGPMGLQPGQLKEERGNNLVGIVGLSVGFGSNFMNAIYAEKRLILHNGSHRAFALRQMGVTHVPCIVQHVASRDELEVVAPSSVRRDPDLYLKHVRPPMLKDYFNPQLRMVMPVHRRLSQVTVRFEVEEDFVPAL
jgi:hypothetical protein